MIGHLLGLLRLTFLIAANSLHQDQIDSLYLRLLEHGRLVCRWLVEWHHLGVVWVSNTLIVLEVRVLILVISLIIQVEIAILKTCLLDRGACRILVNLSQLPLRQFSICGLDLEAKQSVLLCLHRHGKQLLVAFWCRRNSAFVVEHVEVHRLGMLLLASGWGNVRVGYSAIASP